MQNEEPIEPTSEEPPVVNLPEEGEIGPPVAVEKEGTTSLGVSTVVGCLVVGGALFVLGGIGMTPTCGANRSSTLKWEERQQRIDAALEKQEHAEADEGNPS